MGESQPRAGAVRCKLLNRDGDEVIASGNIIWSDGSASEFGSGYKYINSSELSYPRKVDYVSAVAFYDFNRSQIDIDEMAQEKLRHVFQDKWKNPYKTLFITKYVE